MTVPTGPAASRPESGLAANHPFKEAQGLITLATPLALGHLAAIAIGTTDIVMMGWLGPEQLAAGSLAGSLYSLFYYLGLGVLTATAPLAAQAIGGRRFREARRVIRQGLWAALALSLPVGLLIWHGGAFLALIGQGPETVDLGRGYLQSLVWGFLPAMGLVVLRAFVTAHERPGAALVITLCGIAVNALANTGLMFGHFGLPHLELVGAGISSALVNSFMFLALLGFCLRDRRLRRYKLLGRLWQPDWPRFREILRVGIPIGLMNLGEMGAFIASTFLVGLFGTAALAAHAIALQTAGILFMIPWGLSQAATVRVGRAVGAGRHAAAGRSGSCALGLAALFGCLAAVALWAAGPSIAGLFLDSREAVNTEAIELAVGYLAIVALFQLADAPEVVAGGVLRGHKDTRVPMQITLFGYWVVAPTRAVALAIGFGLGGLGVWAALAAAMALVSLLLTRRLATGPGLVTKMPLGPPSRVRQ